MPYINKIKIGTKIKVLRNSNSHNYTIGEIYEVVMIQGNGTFSAKTSNGWIGNSLSYNDVEIVELTLKEFKKIKDEYEKDLFILNEKLKYLEENNIIEFKDNDFFAWSLVKILNSNDKNKEKKISNIINTISNNVNIDILKNVYL